MRKHSYDATLQGVMGWFQTEIWHIGEITGMRDPDMQYSYALSTANSMAHLHDAIAELLEDPLYSKNPDLIKTQAVVVRALRELIRRYKINIDTIRKFNTRHVLRNLSYTRKQRKIYRKSRKSTR
jgi:hypothetical protein